jgi:hypothetical protein
MSGKPACIEHARMSFEDVTKGTPNTSGTRVAQGALPTNSAIGLAPSAVVTKHGHVADLQRSVCPEQEQLSPRSLAGLGG